MHECKYAELIGATVYFITNESGVEVCGFCHAPKKAAPLKAPAKTVRK